VHNTRNPSFLDRVGSSLCAAVFGFFIVVGAFPLLYWNEVRFVGSFIKGTQDETSDPCLKKFNMIEQLAIPKLMSGLGTSVKKCPN
jgi:hypothetical protein